MAKSKLYLFYLVTALYWFATYIYTPMLPTYIKSLGASYLLVGLILGCYGVGQLVLRVPLGIISDRLNMRKIFVIFGLISILISSLGLYFFSRPVLILVFRTFAGVASAFWVIFTVLYSSYFEESEATKSVGILNAFSNGGILVGLLLGGLIVRKFDIRATFFISIIAGVIGLVLSFGIKENIVERHTSISELLTVVKDRNFVVVSIIGVISQFITFATVYGFTPVLAKHLGASDFQIAMLTAVSALPSVIGAALCGSFFAVKVGEKRTIIYGLILAALSCSVIPFAHSLPVLFISQFLGGFGTGTVFPLLMGLSIKNVSSDKRATAMGVYQSVYGLGMFMGPTVEGALSDGIGIRWGFITIGIVALIGVLIALLYNEDTNNVIKKYNIIKKYDVIAK